MMGNGPGRPRAMSQSGKIRAATPRSTFGCAQRMLKSSGPAVSSDRQDEGTLLMADITGDQRIQSEVLEGLAMAVNHRRWFVELALPYLGDNPIEIGSGLGDYALEWADHLPRFTATEADPDRLGPLKESMGALHNNSVGEK